jgi:hypothetical protein
MHETISRVAPLRCPKYDCAAIIVIVQRSPGRGAMVGRDLGPRVFRAGRRSLTSQSSQTKLASSLDLRRS